jgi:hydroxyacylglutathione hydrolase
MRYTIIPVTHYQQNCSLLVCPSTQQGVLIDPGGETKRLIGVVEREQAQIQAILLTHGHLDHVGAAAELADYWQVPIIGPHPDDEFWLQWAERQSEYMGFEPAQPFVPDQWLQEGDCVRFGAQQLEVLHCPGHTPGHVVFVHKSAQLAWVGDVLFNGSVGRSDFPRGDHALLIASIRNKLLPLGDEVEFIPGHGPNSTMGREKRSNPFLQTWVGD